MIVDTASQTSKITPAPTALRRSESQRTQPPPYEDTVDQALVDDLSVLEDEPQHDHVLAVAIVDMSADREYAEKPPLGPDMELKSLADNAHNSAVHDRVPSTNPNSVSFVGSMLESLKLHHAQKRARCAQSHAIHEETYRAQKEKTAARRALSQAKCESRKVGLDGRCGKLRESERGGRCAKKHRVDVAGIDNSHLAAQSKKDGPTL